MSTPFPLLSDKDVSEACMLAIKEPYGKRVDRLARALEETVRTPLLARIAELEREVEQAKPQPRGFLLHWPAVGIGRALVWSDSRIAGDAIGCPVEALFSFGIDAARTPKEPT